MNAYLSPSYSVPESLRDQWPHSVLWRLECGEPVSRREMDEVDEHFKWWQEQKATHEQEREERTRQETDLLDRLKPPIALVDQVLKLARAKPDLANDTQVALAMLLRPHYTTPSDRARYVPMDVEVEALRQLVSGLDTATSAGARLLGRSHSLLVHAYRHLAYRLVRRFERRPRLRASVVVSPQAAIFCWDFWLHIGLLRDAARSRLDELKPRGGRPKSSDWKKQFALEAAALVYQARVDSGLNAPLPQGHDRSLQAVALIIEQALKQFDQNLSRATVDDYATKAVTLLRKLHRANWDDGDATLSESEQETVMAAALPRCCYPPPMSSGEVMALAGRDVPPGSARRDRWFDLTRAFEHRTGLNGAAQRLR